MCEYVEKLCSMHNTFFFLICVLLEHVSAITREYSNLQGHRVSVSCGRLWKMGQVSDLQVSRALELHDPTKHNTYDCGQNIHKIQWESHLLPEHLEDVQEM